MNYGYAALSVFLFVGAIVFLAVSTRWWHGFEERWFKD